MKTTLSTNLKQLFHGYVATVQSFIGYDVFISYRKITHQAYVKELKSKLDSSGLAVFTDDTGLEPGAKLTANLDRSLGKSRVLVSILGKGAENSTWIRLELNSFIKQGGTSVIPVYDNDNWKEDWPEFSGNLGVYESSWESVSTDIINSIKESLAGKKRRINAIRAIITSLVILIFTIIVIFATFVVAAQAPNDRWVDADIGGRYIQSAYVVEGNQSKYIIARSMPVSWEGYDTNNYAEILTIDEFGTVINCRSEITADNFNHLPAPPCEGMFQRHSNGFLELQNDFYSKSNLNLMSAGDSRIREVKKNLQNQGWAGIELLIWRRGGYEYIGVQQLNDPEGPKNAKLIISRDGIEHLAPDLPYKYIGKTLSIQTHNETTWLYDISGKQMLTYKHGDSVWKPFKIPDSLSSAELYDFHVNSKLGNIFLSVTSGAPNGPGPYLVEGESFISLRNNDMTGEETYIGDVGRTNFVLLKNRNISIYRELSVLERVIIGWAQVFGI
ncbi:MAG: hypothetical protein DBP03_04885 [gamma proteobacterium symbiont of Ctena orbiculata]|nr:MAG: hypothetical protein DBP03_04885 [gamma proteobacterium symbiont of Ctena orbiculata]